MLAAMFFGNCEILEKIRTKICEFVRKEESAVRQRIE